MGESEWKSVCASDCSSFNGSRTISDIDDGPVVCIVDEDPGGIWFEDSCDVLGIMFMAIMLGVAWAIIGVAIRVDVVAAVVLSRTL